MVYNVFTPNDDGINDSFTVQTNGTTIYALNIFTIDGVLVFKSVSPTILWDGRLPSGLKASAGTYYYTIESVNSSVNQEAHGYVYLLGVENK